MSLSILGILVLFLSIGVGALILHPFFVQRRNTAEDVLLGGMTFILLFPALIYVAATFLALRIDVPLILLTAFLMGAIGLFYGFKRRR